MQASSFRAIPKPAGSDALLAHWLASGGDERILPGADGLTRYGCALLPDDAALSFSSCTASNLSPDGLTAIREALATHLSTSDWEHGYDAWAKSVRARLTSLCGLEADHAGGVVLAASGTDLHLIAGELARGQRRDALMIVMPQASESGRGVTAALEGRRHASRSPHGDAGAVGEHVHPGADTLVVSVPIRSAAGQPRDSEMIDDEVEAAVTRALRTRRAVMLIVLDVSKTGLLAPSPARAAELKRRHGERLTVLVDACQFRLSGETIASYLRDDFFVALTGSKFLGGPTFSGALFSPASARAQLREIPFPPAFADYSARADWPEGFVARAGLSAPANPGLLMRWEAALAGLELLVASDPRRLLDTSRSLAEGISERLRTSHCLFPCPSRALERGGANGWDSVPTIFPFGVRNRSGQTLDQAETERLYLRLRKLPSAALHGRRLMLGQPVILGERDGGPVSVLRLAIGAGQLAQAARSGLQGLTTEIDAALSAVEHAAADAR